MMVSSHMAMGVLLSVFIKFLYPSFPTLPLVLSGLVGGFAPDADRWVGTHRKSLHYPALGVFLIIFFFILAGWRIKSLYLFPGVIAFWLHSFMDIFDSAKKYSGIDAVWNHWSKKWIPAKEWVIFTESKDWCIMIIGIVLSSYLLWRYNLLVGPQSYLAIGIFVSLFIFTSIYDLKKNKGRR